MYRHFHWHYVKHYSYCVSTIFWSAQEHLEPFFSPSCCDDTSQYLSDLINSLVYKALYRVIY